MMYYLKTKHYQIVKDSNTHVQPDLILFLRFVETMNEMNEKKET